jgi:hypothetical protein
MLMLLVIYSRCYVDVRRGRTITLEIYTGQGLGVLHVKESTAATCLKVCMYASEDFKTAVLTAHV